MANADDGVVLPGNTRYELSCTRNVRAMIYEKRHQTPLNPSHSSEHGEYFTAEKKKLSRGKVLHVVWFSLSSAPLLSPLTSHTGVSLFAGGL